VDIEASDREVFAGNYLTCDKPDIYLLLVDRRPGKRLIEVHNAGNTPQTCTVRPAKGFDLLGHFAKTVTVPAGTSVHVRVP